MTPAQLVCRIFPPRGGQGPDVADAATPAELHNGRLLRLEAPFTNLAFNLGNFYALFAIQLGASNAVVGWLTSGPALISLLWVLPCGQIIQRSRVTCTRCSSGRWGIGCS